MEKVPTLKPIIFFHVFLNCVVAVFITGASYYNVPLGGFKDTFIYFIHLCLLQTTVAGILYLLSLNRWVFVIFFSFLFILYCGFSFWAYTQDISVTAPLIQAVLETQPDIAADLVTFPYMAFMFVAFIVLLFILKWHKKIPHKKGFFIFVIPAIFCILLYFIIENQRPGSLKNRLPYNVAYGFKTYFEKPELKLNTHIINASTTSDSLKMVFVLGETVRADHLSLNGYNRNTMPRLSLEENIISFSNLFTSHTYTGASVPQILTDEPLSGMDKPRVSIYSVAESAGYKTTWVGNQTLEKSFQPIVETNDTLILVDKFKSEFSFDKKLDEALLPHLNSILPLYPEQLITLHMIGSHWWYEDRYTEPFRKFTPVIDSKYIPSLTQEQMINSYDNTIVYLDYFLDTIIETLKAEQKPTILIYVSDHGELLGKDGKYLHAQKGKELNYPAMIIWYSDSYKNKFPKKVEALINLRNSKITTDIIFGTVISLLDINYVE